MAGPKKELAGRIIGAFVFGKLEEDQTSAMLAVLSGAPLLKPVRISMSGQPEEIFLDGQELMTLDAKGNPLVVGRNYLLNVNGEKVRVLRETSGAGNMFDSYQRVYCLNGNLEEKFIVVQGSYPQGLFGPTVYKSKFVLIV
jgi:hypothetical protein